MQIDGDGGIRDDGTASVAATAERPRRSPSRGFDTEWEKRMVGWGRDLLRRFYGASRVARIYDSSNATFQCHMDSFHAAIQEFIALEGGVQFRVAFACLFLNGVRVKTDFTSFVAYKYFLDEFSERGIGSIIFQKETDAPELTTFLRLFSMGERRESGNYANLFAALQKNEVNHILLTEAKEAQFRKVEDESDRAMARTAFLLAMGHLKRVVTRMKSREPANMRGVRRAVESLVDWIERDEHYMLALTTLKNYLEYRLNHSVNVSILAVALGRRLGLDRKSLRDLGVAALLHDLGTLDVPDEILRKPESLTAEEFKAITRHTLRGAEMITRLKGVSQVPVGAMAVTLQHHLQLDLSGYPRVGRSYEICPFARIVAIADYYDAMTSERPYRSRPVRPEQTIAFMFKGAGSQFDALLLKVFMQMIGVYPVGSLVLLDTGELAVVLAPHPEPELWARPRVRIVRGAEGTLSRSAIEVNLDETDPITTRPLRSIVKGVDPQDYAIDIPRLLIYGPSALSA